MRKLAIAMALASTALASPAVARDNTWYAGIEGGFMVVTDTRLDYNDDEFDLTDAIVLEHKSGLDVDVLAGYDGGMFRGEVELGWKRAKLDDVKVVESLADDVDTDVDASGSGRVLSLMLNALLDFGDEVGGSVGAGIGLAQVRYNANVDTGDPDFDFDFSESDRALAWQLIGQLRYAISPSMDVGLKYRYFQTGKLDFGDTDFDLDGKWKSHSLLASLIFNFGAPLPPPPPVVVAPPPPPPPATQTCPDGSVILATDVCPAPPPPPPPPPPAPERG